MHEGLTWRHVLDWMMFCRKHVKEFDWYALDAFWGTIEERNLVDFISNNYANLTQKYDKICLLRNEEVYKIFDFETGDGFQPDFLLLLKGKGGGTCAIGGGAGGPKADTRTEEQKASAECQMFCADMPEDARELGCEC